MPVSAAFDRPSEEFGYGPQTRPPCPPRPQIHPVLIQRALAAPAGEREKIIAALMALLAEKPIEQIGLADIANEAGVSLVQLRGSFSSPLAIVAAHFKDTDRAVLAADLSDMEEELPRERLFDVLMRRLEIAGAASPSHPFAVAFGAAQCAARLWRSTPLRRDRRNGC